MQRQISDGADLNVYPDRIQRDLLDPLLDGINPVTEGEGWSFSLSLSTLPAKPAESFEGIARCGSAVVDLLRMAIRDIRTLTFAQPGGSTVSSSSGHHRSAFDLRIALETTLQLANDHINSISFNLVHESWLRLYTDSCILRSVLDLATGPNPGENARAFWSQAVRRLDMAIIVAGAVGEHRGGWVQGLIREIQQRGLTRRSKPPGPEIADCRTRKKRRKSIIQASPSHDQLLFAPSPIPCLPEPPSVSAYLRDHRENPFILRRYLHSPDSPSPPWPAIIRWRSAEYLLDRVGEGRMVPVEIGAAYDDAGWGQTIIPFRDFLHRAGYDIPPENDDRPSGASAPLYLAQHPLLSQFPGLERDIAIPDYVWSGPAPTDDMPTYRPPSNRDGMITNVWVGSGGGEIISPAHTDPYYNCYAQVLGHKRVWLAPPSSGPHMQAYSGGTATADLRNISDGSNHIAEQYMNNTSTVPILRPTNDFYGSRSQHPAFFTKVWPYSLEGVLYPGDLMVMPPGWWHAMRAEGEGPGWSISMWY